MSARLVTVDTGGPNDVFVGALLTWINTPRGGYGYTMPIDAKVLGHDRRPGVRVTIEVKTKAGRVVKRNVQASALRWRAG